MPQRHQVAGGGVAAGDVSMAVLGQVVAAHELTTADAARVPLLSRVAASMTRKLVRPRKLLLAVRPRARERLLTFSISTNIIINVILIYLFIFICTTQYTIHISNK